MEVFGARSSAALEASLDVVATSDVFVGIYAHRYGYVPPGSDKAITEAEFDCALECNLPLLCFFVEDDFPWPPTFVELEPGRSRLIAFKDRVSTLVVRDTFTTPDDLAFKVGAALARFVVQQAVKAALDDASKAQRVGSTRSQDQVARRAQRLSSIVKGARVMIVNDVPDEMYHVTRILRELELDVAFATSTEMALTMLKADRFDAVVSDMNRDGVPNVGTILINEMRARGLYRPTILTPGLYQAELGTPPFAFGITNQVVELLNLLFDILERTRG